MPQSGDTKQKNSCPRRIRREFCQVFFKKRFLPCIMVNSMPCRCRSHSHIHSMLLCLLLAKPGIAAYCCAKNKSIKARQRSAATFRFSLPTFFCLLLAKPGIAAYCCAKNKSIKASEAAAIFRFSLPTFFSREKKVWSQLSGKAQRRAWTEQSEVKATDHQVRIA